ncbi:MAG: hypothetical protein SF066_06875 [Thermoanaerobaculia bacterium]|nr:hypothetical protein [Thermoanaerobaculia bacterium]
MAETPVTSTCLSEALPLDPHRSLRVRFGMLLGEDDFVTLTAYPRGKQWLHSAWLHRHGVVWGLGVELDTRSREVRVRPGLALDPLGRELCLDTLSCVDLGAWFDAHREDPAFSVEDLGAGRVRFTAHVTVRFRACLDRQVPAMAEPCAGDARTTSYSRLVETVTLTLHPGPAPAPEPPPAPYPRLRLLYGLRAPRLDEDGNPVPADQEVLDTVAALPGSADPPAAAQAAFRRFAALDVTEMAPATASEALTRFPGAEPGEVLLAEVREIVLAGGTGAWTLESGTVDVTVRPAHVATTTLQDLLAASAVP